MKTTPWSVQAQPWSAPLMLGINSADGQYVVAPGAADEATLNIIVTAVNAHDQLVKLLQRCVNEFGVTGEALREDIDTLFISIGAA